MSSVTMLFLLLFSSFIFVPVSVYGIIQLHKRKNEMFMQKRVPTITTALNVSLVFLMCSVLIIGIYTTFFFNSLFEYNYHVILFFFSWLCVLYFLIIKNWQFHYHKKWTYYTTQFNWQRIINSNWERVKFQSNWYIHNHATYGDLIYSSKLFAILFLICFIFIFCLLFVPQIGAIMSLSIYLFIIIFYILILIKTDLYSNNDPFYIHWELKLQSKLIILLITFQVIIGIICTQVTQYDVLLLIGVSVSILIIFITICTSTFGVNFKNKNNKNIKNVMDLVEYQVNNTNMDSNTSNYDSKSDDIHLDMILSHKKAIELFILHLSNEFSLECLLSFIEFTQYESQLIKHISSTSTANDMDDINYISNIKLTEFPMNIPVSEIVQTTNNTNDDHSDDSDDIVYDLLVKGSKMYHKYIADGCEYEINIKFHQRILMKNIFGCDINQLNKQKITIKELLDLFEKVRNEMLKLLNFSLTRFKSKNEFKKIIALFSDEEEQQPQTIKQLDAQIHKIETMLNFD